MTTSRRPKLAALPDVMTSPSWQLLACALRQRRRLSFEALGALLGISEAAATQLCRGVEVDVDRKAQIIALASTELGVGVLDMTTWSEIAPHGRKGRHITDVIVQALDGDDNELVRLHRRAVADGMTTQDFAQAVGVSRQRLWVLEQDGHGVGFDRAVAKARVLV